MLLKNLIWPFLSCFYLSSLSLAQEEQPVNPYQATSLDPKSHGLQPLTLSSDQVNVLAPNFAAWSEGVSSYVGNHMQLWSNISAGGERTLKWEVESPSSGVYVVEGLVLASNAKFNLTTGSQKATSIELKERRWNRVSLGELTFTKGRNDLVLKIQSQNPVKLSAIEVTRKKTWEESQEQALKTRKTPEWFKGAGYGLMFQWTNRATPPKGEIKAWNEKVRDFKLKELVNLIEESGASFVVWSVTWGQQYVSAPIESLDQILQGRTTRRDLLGELCAALKKRGIRVIFYYHYGYDCYHSKDPEWMKAAGGYEADKSRLFGNVAKIVGELGNRYGDQLDGWFFDGGQRFYNAHFDGSAPKGILSASFRDLSEAARQGNEERVICYNSWVLPRLTEYQDFFAGEGKSGHENLKDGVFESGYQKGLMAFGCFPLERHWGHIKLNSTIGKPRYQKKQLWAQILKAKEERAPIAINLEMYEDGSIGTLSKKLLEEIGEMNKN